MSSRKLLDSEDLGDTIVIIPTRNLGEFEIADADEGVGNRLMELSQGKHVVIDLGQTDYFGSSTIGLFIRLVTFVQRQNRRIAFCNLSAHEKEVIDVIQVDELRNVFGSRADAVGFVSATPGFRAER